MMNQTMETQYVQREVCYKNFLNQKNIFFNFILFFLPFYEGYFGGGVMAQTAHFGIEVG